MKGSCCHVVTAAVEGAWEGICGVAQELAAFARWRQCRERSAVPAGSGTGRPARLPRTRQSGALHNLGLAKQA